MTRTLPFSTQKGDGINNPLFIKMKNKFYHDDRAVGDILRQRLESVEIEEERHLNETKAQGPALEHRVTHANFLPKKQKVSRSHSMSYFENTVTVDKQPASNNTPPEKRKLPVFAIVISVLFVTVLMFLLYTSMETYKLKRELSEVNEQIAVKEAEKEQLISAVESRIDLEAIEKTALEELRMVKITRREYIDINSGDAVDVYDAGLESDLIIKAFETSFGQ